MMNDVRSRKIKSRFAVMVVIVMTEKFGTIFCGVWVVAAVMLAAVVMLAILVRWC